MKKFLKVLLIIILAVIIIAALFLGYLTVTEYRPDDVTALAVQGEGNKDAPSAGDTIKILSWNIGYSALGKDSDFVMDGGGNAPEPTKEQVRANINGIRGIISDINPDILMLQEVDRCSHRSYKIDQREEYKKSTYTYALNYKCDFVPFPWPPFMKIESGVMTTTDYNMESADRISLPCPFTWPLRTANLKRCMMVSRIPTTGDNELVIVNFHLEAYDSGEGKTAQTKQLIEFISEEYAKGNYVIAGGDFNQTFPGSLDVYPNTHEDLWKVGLIDADMIPDGWTIAYDTESPTCRLLNQPYDPSDTVNTQYYVIDGFFCSPNVQVEEVRTLNENFEFSDHNPVQMSIKLG